METPREDGLPASPSALELIQVRAKMEKAGLFKVDHWNYIILAAGLVVAFVAVLMCVAARWVVPGGLLMALFWQQVGSLCFSLACAYLQTYIIADAEQQLLLHCYNTFSSMQTAL